MRTIILLTILAVLPISCKFYLYRDFAGGDNALEIAQKMIDGVVFSHSTLNVELFVTYFDKSFILDGCGLHKTLADLEDDIRQVPKEYPSDPKEHPYEVIKAVIEGDYLNFEAIKAGGSRSLIDKYTAIRSGAVFKLIKAQIETCWSPKKGGY